MCLFHFYWSNKTDRNIVLCAPTSISHFCVGYKHRNFIKFINSQSLRFFNAIKLPLYLDVFMAVMKIYLLSVIRLVRFLSHFEWFMDIEKPWKTELKILTKIEVYRQVIAKCSILALQNCRSVLQC